MFTAFGTTFSVSGVCSDILILLILIFMGQRGWKKGLFVTFFGFFRWLICIVAAALLAAPLKNLAIAKTDLDEFIATHIKTILGAGRSGNRFFEALPAQLSDLLRDTSQNALDNVAKQIAGMLLLVLAFLVILLVIDIVTRFIGHSLSHREKKGPVGFMDSFLGMVFGLGIGVIILSIAMLVLFPVFTSVAPDASSPVVSGLRNSIIAGYLYNHNPITWLLSLLR